MKKKLPSWKTRSLRRRNQKEVPSEASVEVLEASIKTLKELSKLLIEKTTYPHAAAAYAFALIHKLRNSHAAAASQSSAV